MFLRWVVVMLRISVQCEQYFIEKCLPLHQRFYSITAVLASVQWFVSCHRARTLLWYKHLWHICKYPYLISLEIKQQQQQFIMLNKIEFSINFTQINFSARSSSLLKQLFYHPDWKHQQLEISNDCPCPSQPSLLKMLKNKFVQFQSWPFSKPRGIQSPSNFCQFRKWEDWDKTKKLFFLLASFFILLTLDVLCKKKS